MQRSTTGQSVCTVYPVANYNFGTKAPKHEKDNSVQDRLSRMKLKYDKEGVRRSVEGVLLVHDHNHPHVLLLQVGQSFFKLPGGRLRPGEDEVEGLRRKLVGGLAPQSTTMQISWEVGECVGVFWRPHFDTIFYPYTLPHVTRPKECRKIFVVPLTEKCFFAIPKNLRLLAVPFFELYDNVARYGPVISALPLLLSRLRLNLVTLSPSAPLSLPPAGQHHSHTPAPARNHSEAHHEEMQEHERGIVVKQEP